MGRNLFYTAAISALLLASPIVAHAEPQQKTEFSSPRNITDVINLHTNALRVFNHSAVHRSSEGRSEIPFEIYQRIMTNYVFSADLARAMTDSTYELHELDSEGFYLSSEKGLELNMTVLDEYCTTDMMRNVYYFDGSSKNTFKGKFESLLSLTVTKAEDGRIDYIAEYWARPKGGMVKQLFATLMIKLFSLESEIDERILEVTKLAEETTRTILDDPDAALNKLLHNGHGIEFDKNQLYELRDIIDRYNKQP